MNKNLQDACLYKSSTIIWLNIQGLSLYIPLIKKIVLISSIITIKGKGGNMKKFIILFLIIASSCLITGCAQNYYIKLKNGESYETPKKPQMNEEGDYMTIEDKDGNKIFIKKDEILAIEEKK
jgi:hypothetical protein